MSQENAYTAKGALRFLGVSLFFLGIGGTVLYTSGEETLTCARDGSRRPMCRLARRVGPAVVRDRDLGVIIDAQVVEAGGDTSRSGGGPVVWPTSYFVEYLGAAGDTFFAGKATTDRDLQESVRAGLVAFANDPTQRTLRYTVPADGSWFAWVPFGLGAAMVVLWGVGFVFPSTRSPTEP